MEISEKDIIGKAEQECWDTIWGQLRDEMGVNSCDACGIIEKSTDLIWIDAEDFRPFATDNVNPGKLRTAIEDGNSALCKMCYKEKCCDRLR